MAGESWKTVTFNEGAPLDANDLNQLQYNLTDVFIANKDLRNSLSVGSSQDSTQSLLMSAGSLPFVTVTANVAKATPLPIDPKFGTAKPSFIVSIGSNIPDGTQVSVGVKEQTTNPQAVVMSNKPGNFVVNYIAFLIK